MIDVSDPVDESMETIEIEINDLPAKQVREIKDAVKAVDPDAAADIEVPAADDDDEDDEEDEGGDDDDGN